MKDRYSGDPRIVLTNEGATLIYNGGQPVMDQGLENCIIISLFSDDSWCGNKFLPEKENIGSDFEKKVNGTITLSKLADIEVAVEQALHSKIFGKVAAEIKNPTANDIIAKIDIGSGGIISLQRSKMIWLAQITDPASRRLAI